MIYTDLPEVEYLRKVLSYNEHSGDLTWKTKIANCTHVGALAGWKSKKYLQITLAGKHYYVHRIIWKMVHGYLANTMQIDHINRNPLDNRLSNLRVVDQCTNLKNQSLPRNNSSGIIGVGFHAHSGLWKGTMCQNNKTETKYFKKKDEAIEWRSRKEREYGFHVNHGFNTGV